MACEQVSTLPTSLSATRVVQNAGSKKRRDIGNDSLPIKRKKSAEAIDPTLLTSKPATAEPVAKDSKKVKKRRRTSEASKTKGKTKGASEGSDEEETDGGLEETYERKNYRPEKQGAPGTSKSKEESDNTSDSEADASQLVHETVAKEDQHGKTRPARRRIHHESPPDETKEQRDTRTIFIGNIPVEVAKSKVCPSFFLFHTVTRVGLTHILAVCSEATQAAYTVARPGGQDRVYPLSFRRVSKTNLRCARTAYAQHRTHCGMARLQGRRHPCAATTTNLPRQEEDCLYQARATRGSGHRHCLCSLCVWRASRSRRDCESCS